MGDRTGIEWTDATWNIVTGRLKAMGSPRYQKDGDPRTSGPGFGVTLHEDKLAEPLRWRKPRMVFVNSMSDLFHEEVPDGFICRVFDVMRDCYSTSAGHVFQILTKRPERMRDFCLRLRFSGAGSGRLWLADEVGDFDGFALMGGLPGCVPLPNVWLGVSIENRRFVHRADVLRDTPAAVRFISAEPLLGPLLYDAHGQIAPDEASRRCVPCFSGGGDPLSPQLDLSGIDWLIVGGESGPRHRRIDADWVRDLRDRCQEERVAFFFKQWGGRQPKTGGRELDGRTWDDIPTKEATT